MSTSELSFMANVLERIRHENPKLYRRLTQPTEARNSRHQGGATPERVARYPF